MKKFIYTSDIPCHTLIDLKGKKVAHSFYKNGAYELPENDKTVKSMTAKGLFIISIPIQKTAKKNK